MTRPILHSALPVLLPLLFATSARAADIYVSPTGGGDGSSATSATTLNSANSKAGPGDTVWMKGGTYGSAISPSKSGTSSAFITYKAVQGELPIIDNASTGISLNSAEYIVVDGVVSRNNANMGFSNKYTDMCGGGTTVNNGHLQYRNVIADGNGISGIAHFCAPEIVIENAIVAHNGLTSSWSSGVNLYGATGGPTKNIVRGVVSFENIDISSAKSDGSGFIMDIGTDGALFQNCVGFRNGGSCFRVTKSQNPQFINNTCWDNSQYDQYGDEIFFSDAQSRMGAVVRNNILLPHSGKMALGNASGVTNEKTISKATDLKSLTGVLDFHLVADATDAIDQGVTTGAPSTDIGFDPACIKPGTGTYPRCGTQNSCSTKTFFQFEIDYEYIQSKGGVAGCFKAGARTANPDIGAYEYNATAVTTGGSGSGGGSANGGANNGGTSTSSGGSSANMGGSVSSGGKNMAGAASNSGGTNSTGQGGGTVNNGGTNSTNGGSSTGNGGSSTGNGGSSTGAGGASSTGSGGSSSPTSGGNTPSNGGSTQSSAGDAGTGARSGSNDSSGCSCDVAGRASPGGALATPFGLALALSLIRRRRRA